MGKPETLASLTMADRRSVARLLLRAAYQHMHLDWHTPEDWLASPELRCWVVRRNGSIGALLGATLQYACTEPTLPNSSEAAWVRFAVSAGMREYDPTLDTLWANLQQDLQANKVTLVGLLAVDRWIESYAARWGFQPTNAVITLQRRIRRNDVPPDDFSGIRDVRPHELDQIAEVDASAFDPLWRYHRGVVEAAARQATMFKLIELEGQIVAYQLCTCHSGTGHLARLAVRPNWQGRGLGQALVCDLLRQFASQGVDVVTVNTQEDNFRSRRLYAKLGFVPINHRVPVWTLRM